MNAFDNYLAIIYKDSINKSFRILIDKLTLTFISKTYIFNYYDGIYSKKFGIFLALSVSLERLRDDCQHIFRISEQPGENEMAIPRS